MFKMVESLSIPIIVAEWFIGATCDWGQDKIKEMVNKRHPANANINYETRMYQAIIDVLNKISCGQYKDSDRIYEAAEAFISSWKTIGILTAETPEKSLNLLLDKVGNNDCIKVIGYLCDEIAKDDGLKDIYLVRNMNEIMKDMHEIMKKLLEFIAATKTHDEGPSIDIEENYYGHLDYRSKVTELVGREQELQELFAFCGYGADGRIVNKPKAVLWWSITGEGGIGKSRLAHEFSDRLKNMPEEWHVHTDHLEPHEFQELPLNKPLFVLIDYASTSVQEIAKWVFTLCHKKLKCPVRILLLERANIDLLQSLKATNYEKDILATAHLKGQPMRLRKITNLNNFIVL